LILDTKNEAAAKVFGRMVCYWRDEAAIEYLRKTIYESLLAGIEDAKAAGEKIEMPDQNAMRIHLDRRVARILEFITQHGARFFAQAQAELLTDALWMTDENVDRETITAYRNEIAALRKKQFNKRIGVRAGREAGQKISKPSEALEHREKILTAMREVYKSDPLHDPQRKRVAPMLGIGIRQLGNWMKEITKETGEEWEDLIVEAIQKRKFKKIFF